MCVYVCVCVRVCQSVYMYNIMVYCICSFSNEWIGQNWIYLCGQLSTSNYTLVTAPYPLAVFCSFIYGEKAAWSSCSINVQYIPSIFERSQMDRARKDMVWVQMRKNWDHARDFIFLQCILHYSVRRAPVGFLHCTSILVGHGILSAGRLRNNTSREAI